MNDFMKKVLILGAGGFIGNHMVSRLKSEGYWVRGVDLKKPDHSETLADEFICGDLRDPDFTYKVLKLYNVGNLTSENFFPFDEIYQFAADMGGAGFIFTGDNDADIMHNSVSINLNVLDNQRKINQKLKCNKTKIFYSSSACIYPEYNQLDPNNPDCREESAYPASPDSEYGWEKLFSERLFITYNKNYGIPVRIARYHNIFGPLGTWEGGREKSPAAICRKIAYLPADGGNIDVWGDGLQTRSFLYINECIEATRRIMNGNFIGPLNVGSEEMVSISELVEIVAKVANKKVSKNYILEAPTGVRGRNSNNDLIREKLGWDYLQTLEVGISKTYNWIASEILKKHNSRSFSK